MRSCLALLILLAGFEIARAQEQEQKLLDRLLKPNTALQNDSQNKKFIADKTSVNKKATVGAFYWQEKENTKKFEGTREFSSSKFRSQAFYAGRNASTFSTRSAEDGHRTTATRNAQSIRSFQDQDKSASTRTFAGNRPFLDKGKSHKSLERKNPPMTIEQVRELLNKN